MHGMHIMQIKVQHFKCIKLKQVPVLDVQRSHTSLHAWFRSSPIECYSLWNLVNGKMKHWLGPCLARCFNSVNTKTGAVTGTAIT